MSSITNLILRWQVKAPQKDILEVFKTRARVNKLAKRIPGPPRDVEHTPVAADPARDLCPAEWLSAAQPQRTILYFHGGGYFFCGLDTHRPVCALLARHAKARVLSVDYRMAPEHPLPAAVDDAVAWWKELLRQGIDPADVVFAGDSAGGGLALACLVTSRAQGLPMPAGALLYSPWTDLSCSGETMRTNARSDVMFKPHSLPQAAALYLAGRPATDPLASPLFADLRGLPELLIFASEQEILLNDSTRLHDKARQQGVTSTLKLRANMPHVWPTIVTLPEARQDLRLSGEFVTRVTSVPRAKAA